MDEKKITESVVKSFWEEQHRIGGYWLTCSKPNNVYVQHGIKDIVSKGPKLRTLEIGIGDGASPKEMYSHGHDVSVVDICQEAFDKVKDFSKTYLTPDMINIPAMSIDLCLCHLTLQHCPPEAVIFILRQAHRSLSQNGTFYFQIAYILDETKPLEWTYIDRHQRNIEFIYTNEEIERFIKTYNVCEIKNLIVWKDGNIGWKFIKIKK